MNLKTIFDRIGETSGADLAGRLNEHGPLLCSLVFGIAIAWYLARLVWLVVPGPAAETWSPPPPRARAAAQASPADPARYQSIVAAHLFGEVSAEPVTGDDAANAPDTSLQLSLRGAIAADDPRFAHAIIADGSGSERVYFIDDALPGGAKLQAVQPDRVVLSRNGQLEVLRLPRLTEAGGGLVMSPAPTPAFTQATNVQEMISQNAAGFLNVVRPQPFMPNGQLQGYRVYPGPNRNQFSAMGLRPGDLITEINGVALNNPTQGMEIFRSLGSATEVTVTVQRDGQPQVLSLSMAQVNSMAGAAQ